MQYLGPTYIKKFIHCLPEIQMELGVLQFDLLNLATLGRT